MPTQAEVFDRLLRVLTQYVGVPSTEVTALARTLDELKPYDTQAELLADTSQSDGTIAYAVDTDKFYFRRAASWSVSPNPDGATASVANIAALSALSVAGLTTGARAYVASVGAYWMLDLGSAIATDAITVVATSGAGRWIRVIEENIVWASQLTWYVSPVTGSDENTGQVGSPIKTLRELTRRLHGILMSTYTVNVDDDVPNTDALDYNPRVLGAGAVITTLSTALIHIVGTPKTPLLTGALVSSVGVTPATQTPASMTDGVTAAWAAYIGKIVRITTGAQAGYCATILKDEGAGVARLSPWCLPDRNAVNPLVLGIGAAPAATSGFEILNLPVLSCPVRLGFPIKARVTFSLVRETFPIMAVEGAATYHYAVEMNFNASAGFTFFNSFHRFHASAIKPSSAAMLAIGGRLRFHGCGVIGATMTAAQGARNEIFSSIFQGSSIRVGRSPTAGSPDASSSANLTIAPGATSGVLGLGIFDSTDAEGAISAVNGSDLSIENPLWGSGNTLGCKLASGGSAYVAAAITPILTGTTELSFAGVASALPPLEASAGAALPALSALTTWAQWAAAPFSRSVMHYGNGCKIQNEV